MGHLIQPEEGLYVAKVTRGRRCDKAGVEKGNIMLKADGKTVNDVATLHDVLYNHKVGDKVSLTVQRRQPTSRSRVTLEASK